VIIQHTLPLSDAICVSLWPLLERRRQLRTLHATATRRAHFKGRGIMPRYEYFPNLFMTLINVRFLGHRTRPVQAVFRVAPKMNKLEVREYLETIYGLPVQKVMTDNFLGGYRRIQGKRALFTASRPNYKRAVVTFARGAEVYKPEA